MCRSCVWLHVYMITFMHVYTVYPMICARFNMMTSSNGNICRVTGHLCGEFTGRRWIPCTKASDAVLWCFLDLRLNKKLSKQWGDWWFETPSHPLWRHCNDKLYSFYINYFIWWPFIPVCFTDTRAIELEVVLKNTENTRNAVHRNITLDTLDLSLTNP